MDVPEGIQSIIVKAVTDNTSLSSILNALGFGSGVDLVETELDALVFALGDNIPKRGDSNYTFSVNGVISQALAANTGSHTFSVTVTDQNGTSASGTLSFNITDSSAN